MRNMTFGDDGMPAADAAWGWVTAQRWPGWQVDVLRAGVTRTAPSTAQPRRWAPKSCEFARVRHVETANEPVSALTSHAGTDLLVVGAGPMGRLLPASLGRTVEALMRRSAVPLIIARDGGTVRKVLVCVPDSEQPWRGVHVVMGLPWTGYASAVVLTVVSSKESLAAEGRRVTGALSERGIRAEFRTSVPEPTVAQASPGHAILSQIDRMRPDLVVVGAPHGPRLASALTGSVAAEVAREANCPVLLAC